MVAKLEYNLPEETPVIISASQHVIRKPGDFGPIDLISEAARKCVSQFNIPSLVKFIDTVAMVRMFSDSVPHWQSPFGRCTNPPKAVADSLGASAESHIYGEVGDHSPLSLLFELARSIQRKERTCVLLCGGEAIAQQKYALKAGLTLDWNDERSGSLDDRGWGTPLCSKEEIQHLGVNPVHFYSLIENSYAYEQGLSWHENHHKNANILAPFSEIAEQNPHSQFPMKFNSKRIESIDHSNFLLNNSYSKNMVAKDSVNQSAALLLCSLKMAEKWNIPKQRRIYINSYSEGSEFFLSKRPRVSAPSTLAKVFESSLEVSEKKIDDMTFIDLYSCFPCVVNLATKALGLDSNQYPQPTVTGGMPFFGGPGNNYSMHAIAESVMRMQFQNENPSKRNKELYAFIHGNGGMLSKHTSLIISTEAKAFPFTNEDPPILKPLHQCNTDTDLKNGDSATVVSSTVIYKKNEPYVRVVIGETLDKTRFIASSFLPCFLDPSQSLIGHQITINDSHQSRLRGFI